MGQVNLPPARLDLRIGRSIVYEDEDLLVVYKPAGLLTVDDDRGSTNLYSLLKERESRSPLRRDRLFVVHRLDRDTSGLLIFARSARVKDVLQSAFEEGAVERRYEAVVSGREISRWSPAGARSVSPTSAASLRASSALSWMSPS